MGWQGPYPQTAAEQFFLDYFEPATDEKDGKWISASAIFNYLKEEVGVTLLKPVSLSVFGRKLTNLPGLQKRVTKYNTEYLVKRKNNRKKFSTTKNISTTTSEYL